ncbi:MAG: pyridoxamine 5'-phosphate oxidase family protein [Clostridiaceae bacterium]|nr:pyridoxamine 5'-phosphate oxidase family protein [Clostridiaceae bacterium]
MRRQDREVTEISDILSIVDRAKVLHLGLLAAEYPYIVPLHYGYELVDGTLVFFMHSAEEGYKLDLIRNNSNVCVELECDIELISGGDNPCQYGSAFASVLGWGSAEIVSDEEEKIKGLRLLMKNQTGRDFEIDSKTTSSVEVIKVVVTEFTAKSRPMPQ